MQQSQASVAPQPPKFGTAYAVRMKAYKRAADGNRTSLETLEKYKVKMRVQQEARKEWVYQHGMSVAVPNSLWPRCADLSFKPWIPQLRWLTDAQLDEMWCDTYQQQVNELTLEGIAECGWPGFDDRIAELEALKVEEEKEKKKEKNKAKKQKWGNWWSASSWGSDGWVSGYWGYAQAEEGGDSDLEYESRPWKR